MDPAYVAVHLVEDRAHWWFRGRRAILRAVLRRALPPGRLKLLEVGCGAGNVLETLAEFGEAVGMEPDETLVSAARAAGLDVRRGALPHDRVVPDGWADVVLMLDVLEHLDDDGGALTALRALVRPGGTLVVMVPAYRWLWSSHDVTLGHRRRYTASSLRRVVERAGFGVTYCSYFNTLLLPAIALTRALKRLAGANGHDLARPAAPVNATLARVFGLEAAIVPCVPMPAGASLLLLARR